MNILWNKNQLVPIGMTWETDLDPIPFFFFFLIYECSDRYLERLLRIFKGLTIKLSAHPTKHD